MKCIRNINVSLIIGLAAVAIPITANVGNSPNPVIQQSQEYAANRPAKSDIAPGTARAHVKTRLKAVILPPQDYYDRRREYWEKRMDRRLEESDEYMDDEDGDKSDKADSKDSEGEDDSADSEADREEEAFERRREYWRQRLDRDW